MRFFVGAFGVAVAVFMVWSLWLNHSIGNLQTDLDASVTLTSRIEGIEPSLRQLEDLLTDADLGGTGAIDEEAWNRAARGYAESVGLLPRDEEIAALLERTDGCARRIQALGRDVQRSPASADARLARISEARAELRVGLGAIQECSQVLLQRSSALSSDLARERRQLDNMAIVACLLAALASGLMEMNRRDNQKLQAAERRLRTAKRVVEAHASQLAGANRRLSSEIAQRTASEKELAQRTQELERSNAELERFAYVASHDLQEPLRAVASHVQILEQDYKGKLDADADESIRHAVEGASHMRLLINDLLAYSRIGRKNDPLEPTSAENALGAALRHLQVAIAEAGADVTHDALPEVTADPTQLIQLFQNLVGNALKFRAGAKPRVHVGVETKENEFVFSVRDNGIGIDPKDAERIFAPFERLHGRHEYPGTGVGLAICKKIAERHGGRIWVDSEPGKGSTFRFTMPVIATDAPTDEHGEDPLEEPAAALPSKPVAESSPVET
jgi:signal transduction histidine kinase